MKAGDLRHRITIQKAESSLDRTGKRTEIWRDVCEIRAEMHDVSSRDYYAARAYQAENTVTFTVRWRDDIDTTCRVVHGNETYAIKQVNHLGYKRDWMALKCEPFRAAKGAGA